MFIALSSPSSYELYKTKKQNKTKKAIRLRSWNYKNEKNKDKVELNEMKLHRMPVKAFVNGTAVSRNRKGLPNKRKNVEKKNQ